MWIASTSIYICSNAEIARQNIQKLNVTGRRDFQLASRITLLPLTLRDLSSRRLNFASFTPGTSFNLRSSMGLAEERVVLYHLLKRAWGPAVMRGAGPLKLLRGGVRVDRFGQRVRWFEPRQLDPGLARSFKDALVAHDRAARDRGEQGLRRRFRDLSDQLRRRPVVPSHLTTERSHIIGELRAVLARTCIEALEPDLIIVDEFQRFRELLDGDDAAAELARHLFQYEGARTLLLSATPYKMVTLDDDASGEDHYRDFIRTLTFLAGSEPADAISEHLRRFRGELLRRGDVDLEAANGHRRAAEAAIRGVMCRTERLAVTADRNGMLVDRPAPDTELTTRDIAQYVQLDQLALALDAMDVTELWKSAPYLLNFMDQYQLIQKVEGIRRHRDHDGTLAALATVTDRIEWANVRRYEEIDPGNARLRSLLADLESLGMWRWLWLPPSLPYYSPAAPFDDPTASSASKRLIFSSWTVVPKMIAALVSYDAERRMMRQGGRRPPPNTAEARARAGNRLQFARSSGRLTGMRVLALVYPSSSLASLGDPLRHASGTTDVMDREVLLQMVRDEIAVALRRWFVTGTGDGRVDEDWYWLAPLLLDVDQSGSLASADGALWSDAWLGEGGELGGDEERASDSSFGEHLQAAADRLAEVVSGQNPLGRAPDDLVDVLALLAVGGPANCALRALSRTTGPTGLTELRVVRAAAGVAWAFRSLFNLPEVTRLVQGTHADDVYWRAVLDYSLAGNLQAVLDEYAHVVLDRVGAGGAAGDDLLEQVSGIIRDTVSIRTVTYSCHDITDDGDGPRLQRGAERLRGRFAVRFGQDRIDEGDESTRTSVVRDAFNSPFWPFVLATTSVGQEGLDFHSYCHACVHWNLPSNPVDLEQREGRVHRYKGHAIRKNVADRHRAAATGTTGEPWAAMFAAADAGKGTASDLVPYWMYDGQHHIERMVPMLPMSREIGRLAALRKSVAAYRLVIGQPRQDDLLRWLVDRHGEEELERLQEELRIDLTPPARRR